MRWGWVTLFCVVACQGVPGATGAEDEGRDATGTVVVSPADGASDSAAGAAAPSLRDASGFSERDAGTEVWWEFGDSLTYGIGTTPVTGYRFPLWQWATRHCHVRFVGTALNGAWSNPVHDGHPGFTIENLQVEARGVYGTHVAPADLVLFMAGTNDMGLLKGVAYDRVKVLADYAALLGRISAMNPSGDILVTTIPPIDPVADPGPAANSTDFNAALPGVWDAFDRTHRHLLRADVGKRLSPWSVAHFLAAGNPHPNTAGYAIMADEFERTLAGHGSCLKSGN